MIKIKGIVVTVLVVALIAIGSFIGSLVYAVNVEDRGSYGQKEIYRSAEEALLSFMGDDNSSFKGKKGTNADGTANSRLTQRVTVSSEEGVLPYSGTVTKLQDTFYPGTYEIEFSQPMILTGMASIEVQMDVNEGGEVYVFTGNKNSGYKEYAVVKVDTGNVVRFTTDKLQKYTISTTDITAAQKAMSDIIGES